MKRGLISRNEKLNEIKEVAEKVYVSAGIGGDEYTSYPNIAVTTVNNGKTFKYIAPANISPARKAVIEKKEAEKKAVAESQKKKYIIEFTIYLKESYLSYCLNTKAEVIMPLNTEFEDSEIEGILYNKMYNKNDFLNDIYDALNEEKNNGKIMSEDNGGSSNEYYIPTSIEYNNIDTGYIDFNEEITVNFTFTNGNKKTTLNNYKL